VPRTPPVGDGLGPSEGVGVGVGSAVGVGSGVGLGSVRRRRRRRVGRPGRFKIGQIGGPARGDAERDVAVGGLDVELPAPRLADPSVGSQTLHARRARPHSLDPHDLPLWPKPLFDTTNAAILSNRPNASSGPNPHHVKCDVSVVNPAQDADGSPMSNVLSHGSLKRLTSRPVSCYDRCDRPGEGSSGAIWGNLRGVMRCTRSTCAAYRHGIRHRRRRRERTRGRDPRWVMSRPLSPGSSSARTTPSCDLRSAI
jgi:hypothetical protein